MSGLQAGDVILYLLLLHILHIVLEGGVKDKDENYQVNG